MKKYVFFLLSIFSMAFAQESDLAMQIVKMEPKDVNSESEVNERITKLEKYANMGKGMHFWAKDCSYNEGMYVDADFLWWKPQNLGYIYAFYTTLTEGQDGPGPLEYKIVKKRLGSGRESCFRL